MSTTYLFGPPEFENCYLTVSVAFFCQIGVVSGARVGDFVGCFFLYEIEREH